VIYFSSLSFHSEQTTIKSLIYFKPLIRFYPDENTINQLAEVVGKRNKVDFEKFRAQINGEKEIISQSKFFDSSSDTDEAVDEDYNEDDNDNGY